MVIVGRSYEKSSNNLTIMLKSFFMVSSSSRNEIFVWNILNTFWWLVGGLKHLSNLLLFQLFISFVKCNSGSFSFTVNRLRPSLAFIYQQSCRWFLKRLQNVKTYKKSIYNTFFHSGHDFWQCCETLFLIFCSQKILKCSSVTLCALKTCER